MFTNDFTVFMPDGTATLATSTTSAAVPLVISSADRYSGVRPQVRLSHTGTDPVFVVFGTAGVTATVATGIPIFGNRSEIFTVPAGATHIAGIQATGTGVLYATSGFGGL